MDEHVTKADIEQLNRKIDQVMGNREVKLSDIRVPLVAVFVALLTIGAPSAAVISNHYRIQSHLANTRIHADEEKSERLGGVAYAGDVAQKERQEYFMMRSLHCGVPNASQTLCASSYPDGPFPQIPSYGMGKP